MKITNKKLLSISVVGLGALLPTANGALVAGQSLLLDFGNQTGDVTVASTVYSPAANTNFINNGTARTSLTEFTTGATVTVGLTLASGDGTGVDFFNADSGGAGTPSPSLPSVFNENLLQDWAGVVNADSFDFTISGLDDDLTYNLDYAVGQFLGNNFTDGLTLAADGQSAAIDPGGPGSTNRFVSLTGLSTDGSGNLFIQILEPNTNVAANEVPVVSGFFLEAVGATIPEPSSTALLGFAGLALFGRRKRS